MSAKNWSVAADAATAAGTAVPQRAAPGPADYEAILAAVMETERDRWFLAEYASGNRRADTAEVLNAIDSLAARYAAATLLPQGEANFAAIERLRTELADMAGAVSRTRAEIAAAWHDAARDGPPEDIAEPIDLVVRTAERVTADVLAAAKEIQDVAWTMREQGMESDFCDRLDGHATAIYAACASYDLTGQQTRKLAHVLRYLEARVQAMSGIWNAAPQVAAMPTPQGAAQSPGAAARGDAAASPVKDRKDVPQEVVTVTVLPSLMESAVQFGAWEELARYEVEFVDPIAAHEPEPPPPEPTVGHDSPVGRLGEAVLSEPFAPVASPAVEPVAAQVAEIAVVAKAAPIMTAARDEDGDLPRSEAPPLPWAPPPNPAPEPEEHKVAEMSAVAHVAEPVEIAQVAEPVEIAQIAEPVEIAQVAPDREAETIAVTGAERLTPLTIEGPAGSFSILAGRRAEPDTSKERVAARPSDGDQPTTTPETASPVRDAAPVVAELQALAANFMAEFGKQPAPADAAPSVVGTTTARATLADVGRSPAVPVVAPPTAMPVAIDTPPSQADVVLPPTAAPKLGDLPEPPAAVATPIPAATPKPASSRPRKSDIAEELLADVMALTEEERIALFT